MLQLEYNKLDQAIEDMFSSDNFLTVQVPKEMTDKADIFQKWLNSSFRKIVLKADAKEWNKIKEEYADRMVLVVDSGLTQIPSGSSTCIGLWPMHKSQASKTIKRLQAL